MFKKLRVLLAAGLLMMGTQSVAFADDYYYDEDAVLPRAPSQRGLSP